jgi:hypothetical protein
MRTENHAGLAMIPSPRYITMYRTHGGALAASPVNGPGPGQHRVTVRCAALAQPKKPTVAPAHERRETI